MASTILRRLFRRFIRGLAPRRAAALVAVAAVVVAGGFFAARSLTPGLGSDLTTQLSGSGQVPQSTQAFLKGNQSYDAELIWSAYTEQARERLRARGGSLEELRRQLAAAREQGTRIESFSYVGGQELQSGSSMHFYLVQIASAQTQGQREYVPYVFTLDASGKIARVQ